MFRVVEAWLLLCLLAGVNGQYQPTWESLDKRPLPQWYDDAKFGIFIHWGVFSVPAYGGPDGNGAAEWYWNDWASSPTYQAWQNQTYGPEFKYPDFASMFRAELWDPAQWAQTFKQSGAQYVVLTSKHHEGFTNWPFPPKWNWNSVDVGPGRDLVGELTAAVRSAGLTMGLYHSLYEWFNPVFLADQNASFASQAFVDSIVMPELMQLVNDYQPDVIWSDGDWVTDSSYWNSTGFISWLYNNAPNKDRVVVNDRWGTDAECRHGDFYTCADRFNPGKLQNHKWENCLTIDGASWGWSRTSPYSNYLTIEDLLYQLTSTVACGGNMLLNVGPTHDGVIPMIFQDRLHDMGLWLQVNGEGIYNSRPYLKAQNQTDSIWYTATPDQSTVFAFVLGWPGSSTVTALNLSAIVPTAQTQVTILGYGEVKWTSVPTGGISIELPPLEFLPSTVKWAFTFKITAVN